MPDDYGDIIAAAAPPKPRKVIRGVEKLQGVQPDLVNHWNNLQTEFDKAGLSPAIKSGFRTAQQQNALHRRGYPTKGNDGFINISPHQEGRALDISFSGAQKPKGREIISAYAKQHGLHVPDDEPWHLALPKQQQGQSNDDYADVVKAATGQAAVGDDSYDDIIRAAIPQQPLRTPKVTSRIVDDIGEELPATKPKPIKFEAEDARTAEMEQGIGFLGRGVRRVAENAAMQDMQLPETHPDIKGKRVPLKFANKPTAEQLNDAFLKQHGMKDIGEQFKRETGGQLLANLKGDATPVWDEKSQEWVVNVRPTRGVIEAINAYATGGMEGLRSQLQTHDIGRANIAKDVQAELKKGEGFKQDLRRTGATQVAHGAQLAQNIADLASGVSPSSDPTAKAIEEAKGIIPRPSTTAGEVADIVGSAAGAVNRAGLIPGHLGFPAEIALENLQRGPEEAAKAAITAVPMMAGGPIVRSVAPEVEGLARQAATRATQAALFGGTAAATGADLPEVLKSAVTGAAFPIGAKSEARDARTLEQRAETIPRSQAQRVPDFDRVLAERDAAVRPSEDAALRRREIVTEQDAAEANMAAQLAGPRQSIGELNRLRAEALARHRQQGQTPETVPEHPSTMQAQFDQRGFALVPHGSQKPSLPRGARAERTADGVVYFDPKRTDAATIRATPTADLLGHVEPKGPTTTETVVARDADGKEVHSSAVSPENVAAQAELTQRNFPDAKVETGGPELAEQVIADRVTPQRYQHLQFGEVEVLPDQSGASTGRVKVAEVGDPTKIHYVKKADLQGRGNSRMIPVPAEAPAEAPTEAPPTEGTAAAPVPSSPEAAPTRSGRRIIPFEDRLTGNEPVKLSALEKQLHDREAKQFIENRKIQRRLTGAELEARTDKLTGLPNKRAWEEAKTAAEDNPNTSIIMADIRNAKAFNTEGQEAGDPHFQEAFKAIQTAAEEHGVSKRQVFRVDGDEAAIVVNAGRETADAIAKRAQELYPEKQLHGSTVGISVGVGNKFNEANTAMKAHKATQGESLRPMGESQQQKGEPIEPRPEVAPEAIEPTQVLSKGEGAGAAVPEPASVTEHELIRLGTRGAREMSGEQRLADMIENEVSPRDVAKEFVDKTYWDAGADAQQRFQKAVMRLTGFKVGDVIGRDAQGNDIVAKDWMDLVKTLDLPKDAKGLEGPERGLVVLMDEANKAARGGAETQEAPRTRQLESAKPVFGSTNKGVTLERADILRARLKTKFDPNTLHDITDIATALPDLVELGAFYVEGGSRQFAQWSKKFLNEFDDKDRKKIEPRLREIYEQSVKTVDGPTSSIRNASTEELRRTLDLSTVEPAERKSFQQSIDNALEKGLDKQAESIANNIISGKTESLSNEEAAGVLHRMRELENRYEELHAANKSDPELAKIEATLDRLTQATKQAGTATARDLNFRKATIDQDFKLISMIRQAKEAKGRDLTEAERTRYESIVKERDTAIRERDTAIEQLSSKRLQAELDRASRQRSRAQTRESLDKEAAVIRSNIAAEFARLKGKFTSTQSMAGLGNLDPEGIITRELLKYARNRAKATVGLKAEALIDDAHELVKDFGVSRRQIAEVLSGYGRVPIDRRGEAAKRLADIRSEITRLLKEEDIAAGRISGKQEGPKRDFVRNANRLKVLQKAEAEWERKFNERDFDPKPKHPYPYNSDVRRAEDRVKIAEAKFRREMERARPGHQFRNLSGIWKAWLLSGPPTQAMNIAGTGTYQAFREVARLPAAIADAAWSGVRQAAGLPAQRSIQGPSPSAMLESVIDGMGRRGLPEFMETMRHGAPRSQLERHQFQEIDFGTNSRAVKLIEKAHNAIFRFMSASDRVFWQGAYRRNLIDRANIQAKNEGVSDPKARARELIDNPPADLKADAEHDAFVSTFNNDNVLSDKIKRARSTVINKRSLMGKKAAQRLNAAENFALDLVLPFDRTPTNVIARIMEASPLGYGKNAAQLISAAMRKSMPVEHQRQMAQTFGNATAGTALMALGWYLADKAKGVIEVDGQDVYLKIPKLPRINLRTASPAGNILAAGARMRSIHEDPKSSKADYVKTALREPANQPVLRATSTVAELAQDPDRSAGKFFGRLAGSAIPFSGAGRFVGQALDPADKRYPDNSFKEQFKKNIPVARETLPASRVRLLGSTVTKATKEAERLKIAIKGATRQPDETDADFKKRQAIQNGNIRTQIENVVALPEYDAASDADKTKWLKQAASFASARTREQLPEKKEQPEERQFPMPQSGVGFDAAYPADALSKYERMNSTQRAAVRDSMTRKAAVLLRDHRLSDEQKAEYKQRLDALGISAAPRPRRSLREQFAAQ